MNALATSEPQPAPVESKCFQPVLGFLLLVGSLVIVWQVVIGYQAVRTSGWFLALNAAIGTLGVGIIFLVSLTQGEKRLAMGDEPHSPLVLGMPLVVMIIVVPISLPKLLASLFYNSVRDGDLAMIRDQAQGMVMIGVFATVALCFAVAKRLANSTPLPRAGAQPNTEN